MDFEEMKRRLESKSELRAAANSAEAQRLLREIDAGAVEQAVKSGDSAALKSALKSVLSTPSGKALAERIQQAVKRDG